MGNVISRSFGGLNEISKGLKTVFKHTFRVPITKNYPDEMPKLSPHFRGRLALTVNPETGENLCISCRQCERVCPDKCIEITAHKSPETNKLELIDFKIDHGLCMFCGLCTEVCPTSCIINTKDFEMADYSRQSLVYDLKKLTLGQDESAFYFEGKGMPLPKPKPAKKPAEPAKPGEAKADAKPAEAKADAKPADAKPAEAKADAKPAEAKADAKPAEAKADAKPAEVKAEAKDEAKDKAKAEPKAEADKSDDKKADDKKE